MGDQLVLCVDQLVASESLQSIHGTKVPESSGQGSFAQTPDPSTSVVEDNEDNDIKIPVASEEEEPLIQTVVVECRICQEEDGIKNLETPCACSGSLKFAHRKCVQRWCNEKGDINCEICHQPYQSGYTVPPPPLHSEDSTIDMSGSWTISGIPLDAPDSRLLSMAATEQHFLDTEYDDYADSNASGAAFCRSAALILMALLLLRHALTLHNGEEEDDDASTFFSLFMLRAAGFLLPCYIMAWAISILQRRRQRQEAAELAAREVAFMLQAGQNRGLQFTISPGPNMTPHQQPQPL